MLGLSYSYWMKGPLESYELIERRREFRTIDDVIGHFDALKKVWGKHLISVKMEFDIYSSNFNLSQISGTANG